jgi:hypothetical protein
MASRQPRLRIGPPNEWRQLREGPLQPVIRALRAHDLTTLRRMYANFFRDPCSTGLVPVPWGMARKLFGGPIPGVYRRACLGDALRRIDYWTAQTRGRFELRQLAGPGLGNPFGVFIDGTLLAPAAEYHHYCAQRLLSQLGAGRRVVAEIGGGYGGMAYYLLRDGGALTYLNFDVPESLALMSWYLMKAFPSSRFLLYGEKEIGEQFAMGADVLLMPPSAMTRVSERSVNVTFSSHAISDLSRDDLTAYLNLVERMTQNYFLHIGNGRAGQTLAAVIAERHGRLTPTETRPSGWNRHRSPAAEVESLYCLEGA